MFFANSIERMNLFWSLLKIKSLSLCGSPVILFTLLVSVGSSCRAMESNRGDSLSSRTESIVKDRDRANPLDDRICFSLSLKKLEREKLFKTLVAVPVVNEYYSKPLNYHIGIGCISLDPSSSDPVSLRSFIRNSISEYIKKIEPIVFKSGEVDYYDVNRPQIAKRALVIYPKDPVHFLALNEVIKTSMDRWNLMHNSSHKMEVDYVAGTFKPHITAINSNIITEYCSKNKLRQQDSDCRCEIKNQTRTKVSNTEFKIGWAR